MRNRHLWWFAVLGFLPVLTVASRAMHEGEVNHHGRAHPGEAFTPEKIAEDVYAYLGKDGGSNSGFIVAPEGVIVIDAQNNADLAANELAAIRDVTNAPIKFLIDTHHHGDHTGGNPMYEKEGVTIISHRECRAAMIDREMKGLPILTFDGAIQLYVGGRDVHVFHFGWGHTKGDAVIVLPDENIVFAGDVLFSRKFPYVADGNLDGWIESLARLKALNVKWVVPGHGPISTNTEVEGLLGFFREVKSVVAGLKGEGKSLEDCKKSVDFTKYIDAGWGGGFFDSLPPMIVEWIYNSQ
ncbi:MAG: MBL fold metallo-hydrolase [Bacteroidota bacterium]